MGEQCARQGVSMCKGPGVNREQGVFKGPREGERLCMWGCANLQGWRTGRGLHEGFGCDNPTEEGQGQRPL